MNFRSFWWPAVIPGNFFETVYRYVICARTRTNLFYVYCIFSGICIFSCIIYYRNLRCSINILILLDAICQLIASCPLFVSPILLLTLAKTIALGPCFALLLVPVFASHITSLMPLTIGIDRFACLFFKPNWFIFWLNNFF